MILGISLGTLFGLVVAAVVVGVAIGGFLAYKWLDKNFKVKT